MLRAGCRQNVFFDDIGVWGMTGDAFHEGEQAVQARVGMRERLQEIGPLVIRDHMPGQHRQFFRQLPFVLVGSLDEQGQPRASLLAGPPGFISSPTERRLRIQAGPLPGDPLASGKGTRGADAPAPAGIVPGMQVGLLGIEQHTRRRNRMNGYVDKVDAAGFEVVVEQSFGNCPKYIQARKAEYIEDVGRGGGTADWEVHDGACLDEAARAVIGRADTFFIASAHPRQGVDVSHRGGPPGFVNLGEDGALLAPEYAGNNFFNTLGNLLVDPRAGLLFLDFESGNRLHVAVRARALWEPRLVSRHEGALRLLHFEVLQVRRIEGRLPLRWGPPEMSPYLPRRGYGGVTPTGRKP